ncbi:hypothetical protein ABZ890_12000 [Streptomyces sp. NPDC046984]|uniref:hypothetical protein n=1 Tax=Streptomyces sp. NPDC046984 TaxID=3155138 RepID=UPI0033DBF78B
MSVPRDTPYGPVDVVAAWLRANDIDPNDVPIEGPITIEQGRIHYAALLRNEAGHRHEDRATGRAAREERTAPLVVKPPANMRVGARAPLQPSAEDIAHWLRDPANHAAIMVVLRREARTDPAWLRGELRHAQRAGELTTRDVLR